MDSTVPQLGVVEGFAPPEEAKLEVALAEFAPSITVIENDRKFEVAVNAAANRASWQITTSKLRSLLNDTLDNISANEETPTPAELKKITEVAALIQEMSFKGYEAKALKNGTASSDFERFAIGAVKAATEGAVKGMTSYKDREERIKQLGRRKEEGTVVEVAGADTT